MSKKTLLSALCLVITLVAHAQEWTAPVVPGQKVGDSLDGLPKGLYICNGKKIMVK